MPDNQLPGKLEDFVARLVRSDDGLLPLAAEATKNIPQNIRRFSEADLPKAIIHTWLAWQKDPGVRMGTALGNKYLDPQSPIAQTFVEWVRRLIKPETAPQTPASPSTP